MITEYMLIASDRDITKKAELGNYLAVDIKKGEPFYPRQVSCHALDKEKLIFVPSFAGARNGYPYEWFYEYDHEYISMFKDMFRRSTLSDTICVEPENA